MRVAGITCAVALLLAATAGAAGPRPQHYYLSLGDSFAYGIQPTKVSLPPSAMKTGYTDVVAERLRELNPKLEVVNYGCPGESTVTYVRGRCEWLSEGRKLHNPFAATQEKAALAFLHAHKGQVSPITLTLWGNDVFPAFDSCKNFACVQKRTPKVVAAFAARLGPILQRLRAAAPAATIVVTGTWNFDLDHMKETAALYRLLDTAIRSKAAAAKARFANMRPLFNPPTGIKARVCAYSFICSADDPHPTDAGYRAYARAILAVAGY